MDDSQPRIVESYRDYRPPFDAARVIRTLLRTVPEKYLRGLDCVVLVNEAFLARANRGGRLQSRKDKFGKLQVLGRYHYAWHGKPPWIEVFVDRIINDIQPRIIVWIPPLREICFAHVFYHELGHHIHNFIRPEYREKEDVADRWSTKLMENFLRKNTGMPFGRLSCWESSENGEHNDGLTTEGGGCLTHRAFCDESEFDTATPSRFPTNHADARSPATADLHPRPRAK